MTAILALLAAHGGAFPAAMLSRYQRRVMRSGRMSGIASYYMNRHGILTVVSLARA